MIWILAEEEHSRGSADPVVARTVMQAAKIMPFYGLEEDREQAVLKVYDKLRRHLHQCDDISKRIVSQILEKSETLQRHLSERSASETLRLPAVENLTNDVETFLYHAKLGFRELKNVFLPTLKKRFRSTTQYRHIANWAESKFGPKNNLTKWLKNNCDWIEELIELRNAVEHPDRHILEIKNFHVDADSIIEPMWVLDDEKPESLLRSMKILPTNILEFSEILLLYCLRNVKNVWPITIVEIPEDKRDSEAPMRFIATLEQALDENGMYNGGN